MASRSALDDFLEELSVLSLEDTFPDLRQSEKRTPKQFMELFVLSGLHEKSPWFNIVKICTCVFAFDANNKKKHVGVCQFEKNVRGALGKGKHAEEYMIEYIREQNPGPTSECTLEVFSAFSPCSGCCRLLKALQRDYPFLQITLTFASLYDIERLSCQNQGCYCRKVLKEPKYQKKDKDALLDFAEFCGVYLQTFQGDPEKDDNPWDRLKELLNRWAHEKGQEELTEVCDEVRFKYRIEEDKKMVADCMAYGIVLQRELPRKPSTVSPPAGPTKSKAPGSNPTRPSGAAKVKGKLDFD